MSEEVQEVPAEETKEELPEVIKEASEESQEEVSDEISPEVEKRAAEMGWVPKEEWRGDEDKWRPADEFVKRGENILPILNDRIKKLEGDLDMATKVHKSEIEAIRKEERERARAEYERQIEALNAEELAAFEDGDMEAFKKAREEREKLTPPEPEKENKPEEGNPVPEFEEWLNDNAWYNEDEELHDYAEFVAPRTRASSQKEWYEKIGEKVKKAFPDKFKNPNREKAPAVERGGAAPKSSGKTFAGLPPEAKASYTRLAAKFKDRGKEFTKEEYVKLYYEGDE